MNPDRPPSIAVDSDRYEAYQKRLARRIVMAIRSSLEEAGIGDQTLPSLAAHISFAVCAVIDGCHELEVDAQPVLPVSTFSEPQPNDERLFVGCVGSYLQEDEGT